MRKIMTLTLSLFLLSFLLLSSCTQTSFDSTLTATATLDGTLRPYPSDTPTATPLPTGYNTPTPSPTVTPTPTQVYYEVQVGDDMYSIAWRYNLSPDVIMTANPTVNPRAMSVGTSLLIPITPMPEEITTLSVDLSPTPTPSEIVLQKPDCYPDAVGGLWCFILVKNENEGDLENISAVVVLSAGDDIRQEIAIMPLNLLPEGEALPLIAYFQPPIPEDYEVSAQVEFFLPVMPDDQRYLPVEVVEQSLLLSDDSRVAEVSGKLSLPDAQPDAEYVWINATAFDAAGSVVAVRRFDINNPVSRGETINFELFLYSLGGRIDRVDLLFEARQSEPPSVED